jgi:GT2 family glycosyltransferase
MSGKAYSVVRRVGRSVRRRVRTVRGELTERARRRSLRASPRAEKALVKAVLESLPGTIIDHGPLVSIVILNRDGRAHLERCLGAVARTTYRDVEVIVVDNGSSDGSADLAESFELPFPIRVIRNDINRTFSDANAQAVAIAGGELICFLNNDVDPITGDWLGYMVETMATSGAVGVGARLIYPRHRGGIRAGSDLPDLSLQHAGVAFDRAKPVPMAHAIGAGDNAVAAWAGQVEERPALTAACLLVRRHAFLEVGGFSPEYNYGFEDVDLCLKLRAAGGRLVYDGRAALWHHESATRVADMARFSAWSRANREAFVGLWGPRIFRDALLDALHGGQRFSSEPFHVAIPVPGSEPADGDDSVARNIGRALAAFGWRVSHIDSASAERPDPTIEAVILLDPDFDVPRLPRNVVRVAWVQGAPDRWLDRAWFDDLDIVFASTDGAVQTIHDTSAKVARLLPVAAPHPAGTDPSRVPAAAICDAFIGWASATRYGIRVPIGDDSDERSPDHGFARGVQRTFERSGHPTRLHPLSEWASPTAARDDVAIQLSGVDDAPTHPGQVNILWQVTGPDLVTPELRRRYDHVFAGADVRAASELSMVAEALVRARPTSIDGYAVAS